MEHDKAGFFAEVKDIAEKYVQDRLLLAKLEATEKVAGLVSKLYIIFPLAILAFFITMIASFLAGYYLSVWLGAYWAGYGIILLLYIILFFWLLYLHRSKLKHTVANKVVEAIFDNKHE
ncbi:phage holin family protein [Aridibaculum aurantiacum]|uniref:phage holin family protein n=1 Tax=Aridibaculum aurantiacum TaxID=2810307 RepID=UPI001A967305|nr:phage holin family protein [Aridibaculum aurantiacum]